MKNNIVSGSIEEMIGKLERSIIELREDQRKARIDFKSLPFYKKIILKKSHEKFEAVTQYKIERISQLIKTILLTEIRERDEEIRTLSKFVKRRSDFSPLDLPMFKN